MLGALPSRPYTLQPEESPSRRVLARNDAMTLGSTLLELVGERSVGVAIEHMARAVTKIANGRVLNTQDGDRVRITFATQFGSGLPIDVYTNQRTDTLLRQVIAQVKAMAPPHPPVLAAPGPVDYADWERFTYQQQTIPPVALWHDSTVRGMDTVRGDVIPNLVDQMRSATAGSVGGAATLGLMARSVLYLYRHGLTAFGEETDSELTVTARSPDGKASGWSGQANRDWTQTQPGVVARQAIDLANRGQDVSMLEPGRRTAILGPAAVAQLVRQMAEAFSWLQTNQTGSMGTPFTFLNHEPEGRHTRFGMRVFDPRIMMISDPADPLGGYVPFFERDGIELNVHGFPTPAITWIDRGVLTHLAFRVPEGLDRNLPPCDIPRSVRVMAAPGTRTATIDDMIANCQEGIYINRFSDVQLVQRTTGMMTGVSRDGCFLVRHGKIVKPIKNFRFMESPFHAFNRLEMIGTPERVAFGYNAPAGGVDWRPWPRLPVIVPPMMIRDFNFSALADAV